MGLTVMALLSLTLVGCSRSWIQSNAVKIVSPAPMSKVSLPFQVRWTTSSNIPTRFALFLDRQPIGPGRTMDEVADATCKVTPGCPDASYLEGLGIYVTSAHQVTIDDMQPQMVTDGRSSDLVHTLTLVAMDSRGRRVGEAYRKVEFSA